MRSFAVKSARHRGFQSNDFCRIVGRCEPFGQVSKFIRAQLPVAGQLECMPNDFGLLLRRQAVDFLNEFGRSHEASLAAPQANFKGGRPDGSIASTHSPQSTETSPCQTTLLCVRCRLRSARAELYSPLQIFDVMQFSPFLFRSFSRHFSVLSS